MQNVCIFSATFLLTYDCSKSSLNKNNESTKFTCVSIFPKAGWTWFSSDHFDQRIKQYSVVTIAETEGVSCSDMSDCDPMGCSPRGSSVRGVTQARILEWVAIPVIKGSSQLKDWTQVSWRTGKLFTLRHQRSLVTIPTYYLVNVEPVLDWGMVVFLESLWKSMYLRKWLT